MSDVNRKAILIVEDHRETRVFLRMTLEEDYDVEWAHDARKALEMAGEKAYDLLLIDIALHDDIDGAEVARRLRNRREYAAAPMIAMTAHRVQGEPEDFIGQGFDVFLPKPFFPDVLLEKVEALLKGGPSGKGAPA